MATTGLALVVAIETDSQGNKQLRVLNCDGAESWVKFYPGLASSMTASDESYILGRVIVVTERDGEHQFVKFSDQEQSQNFLQIFAHHSSNG